MQIFIKCLDGKTITLEVLPHDLVELVMERITEKNGTPYKYQRLLYGGKQLHPDKFLSDYEIGPEATIHLVARLLGGGEKNMIITVTNITGKGYLIVINETASVEQLKRKVMDVDGTWWELQQMMYRNELLEDNMLLVRYGIETGAELKMIPKWKKCSCCSEERV